MRYADWKAVYIDNSKTLAEWEKSLANAGANGKIRVEGGAKLEQARKKDHKFDITETAVNKVALVNTPLFSDEQNLSLREMHQDLLRIAKQENDGNEVALISTNRFTKPCIKVIGTENSVNYDDDINVLSLKRKSYAMELVMAHNHPTTQSFSFADLAIFVIDEYIGTMSVVTNQGQVHIMQKLANFDYKSARHLLDTLIDKYELLQYPDDAERQLAAARDFVKKNRKVGIWHEDGK